MANKKEIKAQEIKLIKISGDYHELDMLIQQLNEIKEIFEVVKNSNPSFKNVNLKIKITEGCIEIHTLMEVVQFLNDYSVIIIPITQSFISITKQIFRSLKTFSKNLKSNRIKFKIIDQGIDEELGRYVVISHPSIEEEIKLSEQAYILMSDEKFSKIIKKVHKYADQNKSEITYLPDLEDDKILFTPQESEALLKINNISELFYESEDVEKISYEQIIRFDTFKYEKQSIKQALLGGNLNGHKIKEITYSDEIIRDYNPSVYSHKSGIDKPYIKADIKFKVIKNIMNKPWGKSSKKRNDDIKYIVYVVKIHEYCKPDKPINTRY